MIAIEKSGAAKITREIEAERAIDPLVPETVSEYVPGIAAELVEIARVDVPPVEMLDGKKLQLPFPVGSPERPSATFPANPFTEPTLTWYKAVEPATTLTDNGVATTVKSGGAGTTSVTVAACVVDPLVPRMRSW